MRIVRFENGQFLVTVEEDGVETLKTIPPESLNGYTLTPPESELNMQHVLDWEWACGPLPTKPDRQCIACIWDRYLTTESGKKEADRRPGNPHTCLRGWQKTLGRKDVCPCHGMTNCQMMD